jgi:hypothetical protein
MSTLQVANIHFTTSGANRIEYTGNNIIRVQANGGFQLPAGTTAERPTGGLSSVLRFNTDTGLLESFNGGSWATVPDGPTFSGAYGVANAAYGAANAEFTFSNSIYAATNSVFGVANAAFGRANTALQNTSGVFAGNLGMTGSLTLTGSVVGGSARTIPSTGGYFIDNTGINVDIVANGRTAAITGGWGSLRVHQAAGHPGLKLVGDTSQTANYMEVESSAGGALFRINSSGNTGIGIASPLARLHVSSSFRLQAPTVPFEWTANAGANDFLKLNAVGYTDNILVINSLGNIGVGTANPSSRLHVASGNTSFQVDPQYYTSAEFGPRQAGDGISSVVFRGSVSHASKIDASGGGMTFYTNNLNLLGLNINNSGHVNIPNQPAFLAFGAGFNGQYFSGGVNIGNYVSFNRGSHFSPRSTGGTGRFTAPVSGVYSFTASILWYAQTQTTPRGIQFFINGGLAVQWYADSASGHNYTLSSAVILALNAGDYVTATTNATGNFFYDNGATSGNYGSSTYNWFSGYLVG